MYVRVEAYFIEKKTKDKDTFYPRSKNKNNKKLVIQFKD